MNNAIKIQFPNDGNIYHIPLNTIAEIRAEYLASRDGFEINSAEWIEEIDYLMQNPNEALDVIRKMDWGHLKEIMVYADSNDDISDKEEWVEEALETAQIINSEKIS